MEHRSVGKLIAFSLLTLGIYTLFWFSWTAKELRAAGQEVPTSWLQIIPIANLYYYWKHFAAAENATNGAVNGVLYFVLALFVSPFVSAALEQNEFNFSISWIAYSEPAARKRRRGNNLQQTNMSGRIAVGGQLCGYFGRFIGGHRQ